MPVPYMGNTLNGWTKKVTAKVVTKTKIEGQYIPTIETSSIRIDLNKQPLPKEKIAKKPEEQRSWKWWSLIVKHGPLLKTDDILIIGSQLFLIMIIFDWTESGFQKYEAIETYKET